MKKALSFLLILCLLLTGCHGTLAEGTGGAAENFTAPEEFDESKPYTVTFWAKNDTNKAQTALPPISQVKKPLWAWTAS